MIDMGQWHYYWVKRYINKQEEEDEAGKEADWQALWSRVKSPQVL